MQVTSLRRALRLGVALVVLAAAAPACAQAPAADVAPRGAVALPARLTDAEFWRLVNDLSEPGGYFRSDNFTSNETSFQRVIPQLVETVPRCSVYVGVGPEQNFTYITALRPPMAFVVDIRRQNMVQHLLYKALMETSPDRAEFLSRLFSRARPAGLGPELSPDSLFRAFTLVDPDSGRFVANLAQVRDYLASTKRFALDTNDLRSLEYVYTAFYLAGPDLTYSFSAGRVGPMWGRRMPTYAELMAETDEEGRMRSYLASEELYRTLAEMQKANLLVPLVGDFGGPKAIRALGQWLRERGATVGTFYTSNVEQYLFQGTDAWRRFYDNVGTMPLDPSSTFVRAVFNFGAFDPSLQRTGPRSVSLLCPIQAQVRSAAEGRLSSYYDAALCEGRGIPER